MDEEGTVEARLGEICREMSELEPRERLELLLEFAENLPPLPEKYASERDQGLHRVQECQTPVFIWLEEKNNCCELYAYVAPEAPTVKGFVSIIAQVARGSSRQEIASFGSNLVSRLGLTEALGMVRARGLTGIVNYVQRLARR